MLTQLSFWTPLSKPNPQNDNNLTKNSKRIYIFALPPIIVPVAELESGHLNEPQSSNYFIQFLRSIRTKTDKTYSIDQ